MELRSPVSTQTNLQLWPALREVSFGLSGKLSVRIFTINIIGIGAAIVRNFANKGCNVIINYATESSDNSAATLAQELEQAYSVRALALRADIFRQSARDSSRPRGHTSWVPKNSRLISLVAVRDDDSEEAKELGEKFGGRAAYAEEIAGLIATICNSEFGWCTGSIITANGGLSFSIWISKDTPPSRESWSDTAVFYFHFCFCILKVALCQNLSLDTEMHPTLSALETQLVFISNHSLSNSVALSDDFHFNGISIAAIAECKHLSHHKFI